MKKNKKMYLKTIIILLIVLIIIIGVVICKNKSKKANKQQEESIQQSQNGDIDMNNTENAKIENGIKQNTSENILKDREIEGIKITDIKLEAQEGLSHFTATVKNDTSKNFAGGVAKITFTNKDGSIYAELEVYIPEITQGGVNAIDAATTSDIINAYNFNIKLEK